MSRLFVFYIYDFSTLFYFNFIFIFWRFLSFSFFRLSFQLCSFLSLQSNSLPRVSQHPVPEHSSMASIQYRIWANLHWQTWLHESTRDNNGSCAHPRFPRNSPICVARKVRKEQPFLLLRAFLWQSFASVNTALGIIYICLNLEYWCW
jgi:hypothetical protein